MMYIHESEAYKYISPGRLNKGVFLFELKVTLLESKPKVWRKILVPTNFTLEQLGRTAACAIGWVPRYFNFFGQDGEFINGYNPYMSERERAELFGEPPKKKSKSTEKQTKTSRNVIISTLFTDAKNRDKPVIVDYGSDGWLHEISFVNFLMPDKKFYPKCIDGENACPPEDTTPDAYQNMIAIMKNPKHK